ncbi:ATP-binding cassette transporter [Reticulomyxa filosa]|uniref:ATP-binding cassette transporter n=1 Tax=Reticulomyxa filosa TaxID=46433 RepID=X6NMK7_RETFI|nr:ATP-binding cassette transporter [Reticulomyxa filosa]|eukprot:ETO27168.1 ATP-binding cassette transporter [Reticulomyxa filosa]
MSADSDSEHNDKILQDGQHPAVEAEVEELKQNGNENHLTQPSHEHSPNTRGASSHSTLLQHENRMQKRESRLNFNRKRLPITLKWEDINYSVSIPDAKSSKKCCKPKTEKQILSNVSGCAKVGELIAIMGPKFLFLFLKIFDITIKYNSGKTTLINVLAGRVLEAKGSRLEGKITINGINRSELGSKFARLAAFVQQDDTVRETLLNAAKFRLPKEMSLEEKEKRVDMIIAELGLQRAQGTKIGDAKRRGVSGGERKRTNIGVELIQDPKIITAKKKKKKDENKISNFLFCSFVNEFHPFTHKKKKKKQGLD